MGVASHSLFPLCVLNLGHQAGLQARLPAEPPFHILVASFQEQLTDKGIWQLKVASPSQVTLEGDVFANSAFLGSTKDAKPPLGLQSPTLAKS